MYGFILCEDNNKLIFATKLKKIKKIKNIFKSRYINNKIEYVIIYKNYININGIKYSKSIWDYLNIYITKFNKIQIYMYLDNNKTLYITNSKFQKEKDDYTIIIYNYCLFFKKNYFTLYKNYKCECFNEVFNYQIIYLIREIYNLIIY